MRSAAIAAVLAAAVALAGCRTHREPDGVPVSPSAGEESTVIAIQNEPVPIAEQLAGQTGVVEMVMTDRGFEPPQLTSTIGGTVKLHVRNDSAGEHNLIVERYGIVTRTLKPGEENYVEFTASEKGAWAIVSDAPGQVEPAFQATLKVE
jgi:hypothetical protein